MRILRRNDGQATVVTILFITVLLGIAAAVLDVGAWFHEKRKLQATVDATALAGAQALPDDPGAATAQALGYAGKNGGGISGANISYSTTSIPSDTIKVTGSRPAPGVFSKILGIGSVTVHGTATARVAVAGQAKYVAPIGVNFTHPLLQCAPTPCFNQTTTLDLKKTGPGAFRLLNLDGTKGGIAPGILADWMLRGYQDFLSLGDYFSDPGAKFNSSQLQDALSKRVGSELLFPIYDRTSGTGANLTYHIIGWVGFHMTDYDARGSSGTLTGWFTKVIWTGLPATGSTPPPNYGTYFVQLVD